MRIEVEKLKEHGGGFTQTYEAGSLKLEDDDLRLIGVAEVRGRIRRDDQEVQFDGELHAKVEIPCARCLKPVVLPLDGKFAERFAPQVSWRTEEQHELHEEDLNLAVFDGESIELDDLIREEILLRVPNHVLCRDDCKGLCPRCGIDLNANDCDCQSKETDVRWDALKDLRF